MLSPFSTRFDTRVPPSMKPLWFGVKWGLGGMGAYLLVGNYVMKWGWPATIWIVGAPLAYGIWQGIKALPPTPPTSPPPRQ